jgi:putative salt-induced outer membrane protein
MLSVLIGTVCLAALPEPAVAQARRRVPASGRVRRQTTLERPELEVEPVFITAPPLEVSEPVLNDVGVVLAKIPGPEISPEMRAMLDAAMQAGDEAGVDTLVKYARNGDPGGRDLVLRRATEWKEGRARARNERVRQASAFQLWSGRVEAGGFVSSGNSDVTGITGVADLTREGLRWRHRVMAQADFQRTAGVTSRERYALGYQPNYKLNDRGYIYGNGQYESDRFLGYFNRYSASVGAGYSVFRRNGLTLDIEVGPAFRQTDFTDRTMQGSIAARGSMELNWTLFSGLTATQSASGYWERYNSTIRSVSAIEAKLLGPLSARLSYTLQYESEPPAGRVTTDTTSRASLVYAF